MACWQTCASCKEAYIASAVCTEAIKQDNIWLYPEGECNTLLKD